MFCLLQGRLQLVPSRFSNVFNWLAAIRIPDKTETFHDKTLILQESRLLCKEHESLKFFINYLQKTNDDLAMQCYFAYFCFKCACMDKSDKRSMYLITYIASVFRIPIRARKRSLGNYLHFYCNSYFYLKL